METYSLLKYCHLALIFLFAIMSSRLDVMHYCKTSSIINKERKYE